MQKALLRNYADGKEAFETTSYPGALGFMNRDRAISALIRKGLIDKDQVITDAGLALLNGCTNGQ